MKIQLIRNLNFVYVVITLLYVIKGQNEIFLSPKIYPLNFISLNKDIIIIDSKGIHFYNCDLTAEVISKNVAFENKIENEKIYIKQYSKESGAYIIILVFDILYFFESDGTKINSAYMPFISNADCFCLVPYKKEKNYLYYIIVYTNKENFTLKYFKYNINSFSNQIIWTYNIKINEYYNYTKFHLLNCLFLNENSDYDDVLTCFIYNFNRAEIITRTFDINNNLEIKRNFKPYNSIIPNITNNNKAKNFIFLINNEIYRMNFTNDNLLSKPENLVIKLSDKIRLLYNKNNQTHEFLFISSSFDKLLLVFNNNFSLIALKLFNSKTSKFIYPSFKSSHKKENEISINKGDQLDSNKFYQKNIIIISNSSINLNLNYVDFNNSRKRKEDGIKIIREKNNKTFNNIKFKLHRRNLNEFNNKTNFIPNNDDFNNLDKRENNDSRNKGDNNSPSPLPGMNDDRNRDRNNTPPDMDPTKFNMTEREMNNNRFDLGECEQILRTQYNLSDNITLIINETNNNNINRRRRGPMSIEVYEPINNTKLNLSLCNNARFRVDISVNIDERDLFKYDKNSSYYNDICFTYTSEKGTDVILNDRRKEFIRNNMSLCERNCNYRGYDMDSKNAKCDCEIVAENSNSDTVSESESDDDENFFNNFINITSISNIEVLNCYKNIFTKDGLIKNCGSYIILTITLIYVISLIYFIIKGYNNFLDKINIIIKNSHVETIPNNHKLSKVKGKIKSRIKTIYFPPKKKFQRKNDKKIKKLISTESNTSKNNLNSKIQYSKTTIHIERLNKKNLTGKEVNYIKNNFSINKSNNSKNKFNNIMKNYNDFELNTLSYKEALEIDKRTYYQYYFSLLRAKHIFIFTFITKNDYNSFIIKICLFFFGFALYSTVNILFFNDSTMHKIYEDNGKFNLAYQIPQIIYSTIISSIINFIIRYFSLSEKDLLKIKHVKKKRIIEFGKLIKCLRIKFSIFFIFSFIFLFLFWFYLSCFCSVYINTQRHAINDALISFGLSLLYPFLLNLIPGLFRIASLNSPDKQRNCMYKISQLLEF